MTTNSDEVEWTVQKEDGQILLSAFDVEEEGDVVVYTLDPLDASFLAAAIFDVIEGDEE